MGIVRIAGIVGVLALLGEAATASAQMRGIRGQVVDGEGQAVADAVIEAAIVSIADVDFGVQSTEPTWTARTNASGDYIVAVPRAGEYVVTALKEGVGSDRRKVAVRSSGLVTANLTLWKTSVAVVATVSCGTSSPLGAFKRNVRIAGADAGMARLAGWLEAVHLHTPGCRDTPAIEVSRWPLRDLVVLMRDVRELVTFLHGTEGETFLIYDRRFTLDELERGLFGGQALRRNDLLRRGAVLHADVGILVPGDLGRYPLVEDGGRRGWRGGSSHWELARQLLDSITPLPGSDAGVILWYRAVSAHLLETGNLAELTAHLIKARALFPQNPDILLDSAYLHQELSSPPIQASLEQLRGDAVNVAVGSRRSELQRAERYLREVLAVAPGHVDAHLRLGHTLGALGRHQEAAIELRKTIDANPDIRRRYLAQLFLGREEEALGRRDEARRRYEQAANLYPGAQSPQLALSGLARRTGDTASAQGSLLKLAAISSGDSGDPWWEFYHPHEDDADDLILRMRQIGNAK